MSSELEELNKQLVTEANWLMDSGDMLNTIEAKGVWIAISKLDHLSDVKE